MPLCRTSGSMVPDGMRTCALASGAVAGFGAYGSAGAAVGGAVWLGSAGGIGPESWAKAGTAVPRAIPRIKARCGGENRPFMASSRVACGRDAFHAYRDAPNMSSFAIVSPHLPRIGLPQCTTKTRANVGNRGHDYTEGRGRNLGPFKAAPLRFLSSLRGKTLLIILV